MNPGNGIETIEGMVILAHLGGFPINESRQRDWNIPFNRELPDKFFANFLLMNPGNGIETSNIRNYRAAISEISY